MQAAYVYRINLDNLTERIRTESYVTRDVDGKYTIREIYKAFLVTLRSGQQIPVVKTCTQTLHDDGAGGSQYEKKPMQTKSISITQSTIPWSWNTNHLPCDPERIIDNVA